MHNAPFTTSLLLVLALGGGGLVGQDWPACSSDQTLRCAAGPAAGEVMPPLSGFALDGTPRTINFAGAPKPALVYLFSPFGACVVRNERNFAALVRARGGDFHVVAVSPNPANNARVVEYIASARPSWGQTPVDVLIDIPDGLYRSLALFGYPDTLVVSPTGIVLRNFAGAYEATSAAAAPRDLEAFFHITLPGNTGAPCS